MSFKKYRVIAKVPCTAKCFDKECPECKARGFKKWNCNDLMKFTAFLDSQHPDWRWFNVYAYIKKQPGRQVGNFSRNSRPTSRFIC